MPAGHAKNQKLAKLVVEAAVRKGKHVPYFITGDLQGDAADYFAFDFEHGEFFDAAKVVASEDSDSPTYCAGECKTNISNERSNNNPYSRICHTK